MGRHRRSAAGSTTGRAAGTTDTHGYATGADAGSGAGTGTGADTDPAYGYPTGPGATYGTAGGSGGRYDAPYDPYAAYAAHAPQYGDGGGHGYGGGYGAGYGGGYAGAASGADSWYTDDLAYGATAGGPLTSTTSDWHPADLGHRSGSYANGQGYAHGSVDHADHAAVSDMTYPGSSYRDTGDVGGPGDFSDFSDLRGLSDLGDIGDLGFQSTAMDDVPYPGSAHRSALASDGMSPGSSHRRAKRGHVPVRAGLLGVSAAVAMGAVAVASGVIPGSDGYSFGGGGSDKVRAADSPTAVQTQGGTGGSVQDSTPSGSGQQTGRSGSPSSKHSSPSGKPSGKPSSKKPSATGKPGSGADGKSGSEKTTPPAKTPTKVPRQRTSSPDVSAESAAASAVLSLVNDERAKVGCSPVTASSGLADLATAFSEDMAARNFFAHTSPDGATPWDRAAKAGITDLGGENIARGQADAKAVMEAWMNSPGHRANILNCDYKTLGVGIHFGSGGPWWTQDFGF